MSYDRTAALDALAILTALHDDDSDLLQESVPTIVADHVSDQNDQLVKGLLHVAGALLHLLERETQEPAEAWLRRLAAEFAREYV